MRTFVRTALGTRRMQKWPHVLCTAGASCSSWHRVLAFVAGVAGVSILLLDGGLCVDVCC